MRSLEEPVTRAKKNRLVLFGMGQFAELAWYVFTHDSDYEVVAFTADRPFVDRDVFLGLPLVPFDEVQDRFSPEENHLCVSIGYRGMNDLRQARFEQAKQLGYSLASYVSSRASVWPDLSIGENCMIFENAVIQPFARIGHNTIIRSGAHVSHHVSIGDHCFVAAEVAIGGGASLGNNCFVGLNATLRDNTHVAARCFIAASSYVHRDTQANGLYMGSPARRHDTDVEKIDGGL